MQTALVHKAVKQLNRNFTIWTLLPNVYSQTGVSGTYDIQNVLVFVSRGLCLIAVNMRYAKYIVWNPLLQFVVKLSSFQSPNIKPTTNCIRHTSTEI